MSKTINRVAIGLAGLIGLTTPIIVSANTAPEISGTPDTTINLGQEYRFQPTVFDADGDEISFIIRRQPSWLTFNENTGELSGTPTLADVGSHNNILIIAKDKFAKTRLRRFGIDVINPPPQISGTPATHVNADTTYRFTPDVVDPNDDKLTFGITNKPGWASFNTKTGELTGSSSTVKTRNYRNIVISVSDGMSTVSLQPFHVAVVAGEFSTSCTASIQSSEPFSCQLPADNVKNFTLIDPPRGLSIQPRTGAIHWTPTADQAGQHYVGVVAQDDQWTKWVVDLNVAEGSTDAAGIYVAPDGDDSAAGTAAAPFQTIKQATDIAVKGDTIYLRGGVYYNEEYGESFANRRYGSMARITTSGTGPKPITLRPYGNEYVKLISDVNVLQFKGAQHWVVEGLELEGTAQALTKDDVMKLWWQDDNDSKITGRGISTNASQYITVRNNVIHDFPGAGVGNNGSDMITVENNVIYHNGWWSTAGTHGVSNSYLTTVKGNESKEGLVMAGNLVFGNQSRVISHVFSKGNVDLAIDEGNGLHAQNNSETFSGKARVENNLMLFNGKAGFGVNTMDAVRVKNNAFYQNAQIVNTGELAVQSSDPTVINGNLFQPLLHRKTASISDKDYSHINNNASTHGADAASMPATTLFSTVFRNPELMDFTPDTEIPDGMGVPAADLQRMINTLKEYAIEVKAPSLETNDENYLSDMKQVIFSGWPSEYDDITLTDRATKIVYTYEQRCDYPGVPAEVCQ